MAQKRTTKAAQNVDPPPEAKPTTPLVVRGHHIFAKEKRIDTYNTRSAAILAAHEKQHPGNARAKRDRAKDAQAS